MSIYTNDISSWANEHHSFFINTSNYDVMLTSTLPPIYKLRTTPPGIAYSHDMFHAILNQVVVPILFGIITFVGVTGNSLVIYVILSKDRMRTVTNLLLLNLAVADFLFALVIPSVTAYSFATSRWPFGDVTCRLMHYCVNVTAYITVYTLVVVSIVRFMTIVHNANTARFRTRKNVVLLVFGLWIVTLIVNIPILMAYTVKVNEYGHLECEYRTEEIAKYVFSTFFVFAYLLPLAIIAVFSVCILHHLSKHRSLVLGTNTRSADKKKRAGMLLILVVVVFAILWLPIHIHLLIVFFDDVPKGRWYQALMVLWHCLAYFNSCVNPIIYNHSSKDFRDAFHDVACCTGPHVSTTVSTGEDRTDPPGVAAGATAVTVTSRGRAVEGCQTGDDGGGEGDIPFFRSDLAVVEHIALHEMDVN